MAKIPEALKDRPIVRGFVVPWFVHYVNGEPDFRIMDAAKIRAAISQFRCWMCGGKLRPGAPYVFMVGPMCVVNRISSEPPSHPDCARYAAQVCPFLTRPHMKRREDETSKKALVADGSIKRNPGVTALVFARSFETTPDSKGMLLFRFSKPIGTEWYSEGRVATREEVIQSFETGLPEVRAINEMRGPQMQARFERDVERAMSYVPRA